MFAFNRSLQPHIRTFRRTIIARNALPTDAGKQTTPYLNIKLPDLSAPLPEPEVYIPFTPDFWESSRARAEAAPAPSDEPEIPKVIVVAGDSARADSTHIFSPAHELVSVEPPAEPVSNLRGLFYDLADDLALPKDFSALKANRDRLALVEGISPPPSTGRSKFQPRTLNKDEVKGVWIILGLFVGSWLAGGWLKRDSKYAESD
ncbi:hypothetical protein BC827DRAFT_1264717 [Russula dissimulans]|nr:hypothetical protein BC827DRAFT_1264717 [Russula dissimulans]